MRIARLCVGLALVALSIACAREQEADQSSQTQTRQLDVTATDFEFDGVPATIEGGNIDLTFRNDGKANHEIALVQIGDKSPQDLAKVIASFDEGAPFPSWMRKGTIPGEVPPGETLRTTFTLPAGEYTLACTLTDAPGDDEGKEVASHATLGMFERVTVEGDEDPRIDAQTGEFTARDYTFDPPSTVATGKQTFVFRNTSETQWHHMVLQSFPAGTTPKAATKAWEALSKLEEGQAPPAGTPQPEDAGFTGIMSPGMAQTVELDFKPNTTYIAICFIHDIEGGPPHAMKHKMYKAFST